MRPNGFERFGRKESAPDFTTFQCARCHARHGSIAGTKFVYIGLHKRRICTDCVKKMK